MAGRFVPATTKLHPELCGSVSILTAQMSSPARFTHKFGATDEDVCQKCYAVFVLRGRLISGGVYSTMTTITGIAQDIDHRTIGSA